MGYARPDLVLPSAQDASLARAARLTLEASPTGGEALHIEVKDANGARTALDLPSLVARLLMEIPKETAAGNAVTLVPVGADISMAQAASLLNVSSAFVADLVNKGDLPARDDDFGRRLPLPAVLAWKAEDFARRESALDELVALDQENGLI